MRAHTSSAAAIRAPNSTICSTNSPDRESAAKLGHAAIAQAETHSDVRPVFDPKTVAHELRTGPGNGSLVRAMDADIAQGRLVIIQGWVLPASLVLVAGIAATVQRAP